MIALLTKLYLIIGTLCCASFVIVTCIVSVIFKQNYPMAKLRPVSVYEKIFGVVRVIIMSFIPLFNVLLLAVYVFGYDRMIEQAMETLKERIIN